MTTHELDFLADRDEDLFDVEFAEWLHEREQAERERDEVSPFAHDVPDCFVVSVQCEEFFVV